LAGLNRKGKEKAESRERGPTVSGDSIQKECSTKKIGRERLRGGDLGGKTVKKRTGRSSGSNRYLSKIAISRRCRLFDGGGKGQRKASEDRGTREIGTARGWAHRGRLLGGRKGWKRKDY